MLALNQTHAGHALELAQRLADNSIHLGIAKITQMCYNNSCLDECDTGRFAFSNAINLTQYFIVGKAPLISGLTSRHSSRQRWQANKGLFVMGLKIKRQCPKCSGELRDPRSLQCRACYLKERVSPSSYITKQCPICKKPFTVHKGQLKVGQGKYCSRACARSGSPTRKQQRVSLACDFCQKIFKKYPAEMRKSKGAGNFCSAECWYAHNQGKNHYGYTGATPERQACYSSREWKQAVKKVWERDKATCQRCKKTPASKRRKAFHIHHIISFTVKALRTDASNLVLLCPDCHRWVHSKENVNNEFIKHL